MRVKAGLACLATACAILAAAWPSTVVAVQQSPACVPGTGTGAGVIIHVQGVSTTQDIWCSAMVIQAEANMLGPVQNPISGAPITSAITVRTLLHLAMVAKATHFVLLTRPNGTPSTLNRAELVNPASSFIGGVPPVVSIAGPQTEYLRPARPGTRPRSQADSASETISQNAGTPLDLYVFTGRALRANIVVPNSNAPPPHRPVQLSAYPRGSGYTYIWNFGDGGQRAQADISHTFNQTGPQDVYVTVMAPGGSAGAASTQLTVSPPHRGGVYHPPPAKTNTTPGTGTGSGNPTGGTSPGSTNTTDTTTTTTPTTSSSTNPSQGTRTTPSGGSSAHVHTGTTPPVGSSAGQGGGTIVTGRLISAVTPVSPAQLASGNVTPPTPVNERVAPAAAIDNGSVKPIASIVGGCAVVLLLLSGAGRELQSLRRSIASARLN